MKDQTLLVSSAQKLKQHGIKSTPQRQAILAYLMCSDEHPSITMIHQYLQKQDIKVSLATVYNTLELLAKSDLVSEVALDSAGHVRYDYFAKPHYHLICLECGKIEDIFDDTYLELEKLAQAQSDYEIANSRYDVYGICPECQQKKTNA
ncbi:Fur family transcriptional regulator [Ligilactobacillus animalis]|uniref:Fur family transcriptional regulator n=1 Tax=Ligilactobacillus animalis TaxID=1605 RepID=UPI002649742B|nr:Fur family transcriptional regulator [Ligilactobacillus animalis]WKB73067.1 Fur family transcriptional regulator [Ligilactobacillus animalis]